MQTGPKRFTLLPLASASRCSLLDAPLSTSSPGTHLQLSGPRKCEWRDFQWTHAMKRPISRHEPVTFWSVVQCLRLLCHSAHNEWWTFSCKYIDVLCWKMLIQRIQYFYHRYQYIYLTNYCYLQIEVTHQFSYHSNKKTNFSVFFKVFDCLHSNKLEPRKIRKILKN